MQPYFFLPLLLLVSFVHAQAPLILHGKLPGHQVDLAFYTSFYDDLSGDTLPLQVVQTKEFKPLVQRRNAPANFAKRAVQVTWLRFKLQNTHPTDTMKLFYWAGHGHGQIMTFEGRKKIDETGFNRLKGGDRPSPFAIPILMPPMTEHTYWVRVMNATGGLLPIYSQLMTGEESWKQNQQLAWELLPFLILMSVLAGCVLFMGAYALYHYRLTRDSVFLYYSLYAGFGLFHIVKAIDFLFGIGALMQLYPPAMIKYPFNYSIILIFYTLFLNQLLQIRTQYPRLWQGVLLMVAIIAFLQGITIVETLRGWPLLGRVLFNWIGLVSGGSLVMGLLLAIIRSRSPIRPYLLIGNGFLLSLVVLPLLLFPFFQHMVPAWHFVYLMSLLAILGFTGELFCFAMALAYRSKLSERKLAETKMKALQAQMNPHFIFNCLTSIELCILENNMQQAAEYLSKFARLIRLVLDNSRSKLITLKKELDALQLYLEMEAMRFKDKVQFTITVEPTINTLNLKIPPLLLQPYVENAIKHGLRPKLQGGRVTIDVYQPRQQQLSIEISDNGIGRKKAAESAKYYESFSTPATAERIEMINQLYNIQAQIHILDLFDNNGEPRGTKVVLRIPV